MLQRLLTPLFIMLALLCAATAYKLAAPSSVPVIEQPPLTKEQQDKRTAHEINFEMIRRIHCYDPATGEGGVGTAWVIDEDTMVTAAHVTGETTNVCYDIDGLAPVKITHVDWHNDFAMVAMETGKHEQYIAFSCDGFRTGEHYMAIGWAGGNQLKQTQMFAQGVQSSKKTYIDKMRSIGLRFLTGRVYKGMSGGPIFADYGVVVGINSATDGADIAYSRDLRDTVLCGEPRKNDPQHSDIFKIQAASSFSKSSFLKWATNWS